MKSYKKKVEKAAEFIQKRTGSNFKIGIILGSGLGEVAEKASVKAVIEYRDIPGFPVSMVEGHKGELIYGEFGNKDVIIFNGRYHYYQGCSLQDVTMIVRVAGMLGVRTLIITNASGGINRDFKPGDIMLINDHINLIGTNPLVGIETSAFGQLFINMTEPYDRALIKKVMDLASGINEVGALREGVYIAVSGPSYETKAEISFFEKIGADAVGMSTVPEVIVASQEGIRVLGLSIISNMASGIAPGKLNHSEVLENMSKVSSRLIILLEEIVKNVL